MAYGYQHIYNFSQPPYQWPQNRQQQATERTTATSPIPEELSEASGEHELISLTVKIMCPNEKRGEHKAFILRDVNLCEITTLDQLRDEIFSQFGSKYVNKSDFDVGYFEGPKRIWIRTDEDLNELFKSERIKSTTLWCAGHNKKKDKRERRALSESPSDSEEDVSRKRKKKRKGPLEERNDLVDGLVDKLREKHAQSYSSLQYRVWAETIAGGRHTSLENPPKGSYYKKNDNLSPVRNVDKPPTTITPVRAAELRSTYIRQIKDLHSLLDIGAIAESDFEKQKQSILELMDKLL